MNFAYVSTIHIFNSKISTKLYIVLFKLFVHFVNYEVRMNKDVIVMKQIIEIRHHITNECGSW